MTVRRGDGKRRRCLAAAKWYDDKRADLGRDLLDSVDKAFELIADQAAAYAPVPGVPADLNVRRIHRAVLKGRLGERSFVATEHGKHSSLKATELFEWIEHLEEVEATKVGVMSVQRLDAVLSQDGGELCIRDLVASGR